MSFVNFSNHPSKLWSPAQFDAAKKMSHDNIVVDIPFPAVSPYWSEEKLCEIAVVSAKQIVDMSPDAVMVQGEFGLCVKVIGILMEQGITTVCACSERHAVEWLNDEGKKVKQAEFEFIQFRRYVL